MTGTETRVGITWIAGAAGLLLAAGLLAAPAAQAGDDFERGFKNELGRIAAHEAVTVGFGVLGEVFAPVFGGHGTYASRGHHRRRHYSYGGGHRGRPYVRHFRRHHRQHHRYGHHDQHGRHGHQGHHGSSCGYERHESYERDSYSGHERYERHERAYPNHGHTVSYRRY